MTARILIVDDAPTINRLTAAKLESEYYQVSIAYDGQTALDRARDWQPDVILLDVMMPGIDGYETCRRLKTADATMHIPVVMISGAYPKKLVRQLLTFGADYLMKKTASTDLKPALENVLNIVCQKEKLSA